jgi:hypothetical protein
MTPKTILPTLRSPWRRLVDLILRTRPAKPPARPPSHTPARQPSRHREKLFPMF